MNNIKDLRTMTAIVITTLVVSVFLLDWRSRDTATTVAGVNNQSHEVRVDGEPFCLTGDEVDLGARGKKTRTTIFHDADNYATVDQIRAKGNNETAEMTISQRSGNEYIQWFGRVRCCDKSVGADLSDGLQTASQIIEFPINGPRRIIDMASDVVNTDELYRTIDDDYGVYPYVVGGKISEKWLKNGMSSGNITYLENQTILGRNVGIFDINHKYYSDDASARSTKIWIDEDGGAIVRLVVDRGSSGISDFYGYPKNFIVGTNAVKECRLYRIMDKDYSYILRIGKVNKTSPLDSANAIRLIWGGEVASVKLAVNEINKTIRNNNMYIVSSNINNGVVNGGGVGGDKMNSAIYFESPESPNISAWLAINKTRLPINEHKMFDKVALSNNDDNIVNSMTNRVMSWGDSGNEVIMFYTGDALQKERYERIIGGGNEVQMYESR